LTFRLIKLVFANCSAGLWIEVKPACRQAGNRMVFRV